MLSLFLLTRISGRTDYKALMTTQARINAPILSSVTALGARIIITDISNGR